MKKNFTKLMSATFVVKIVALETIVISMENTETRLIKIANLKGQCHAVWQLYKNLEGVFSSKTNSLGLLLKTI